MAPAEIWQGGRVVNEIKGSNTHTGRLDGKRALVADDDPGCIIKTDGRLDKHFRPGESITLDGGEIVKSVRN